MEASGGSLLISLDKMSDQLNFKVWSKDNAYEVAL